MSVASLPFTADVNRLLEKIPHKPSLPMSSLIETQTDLAGANTLRAVRIVPICIIDTYRVAKQFNGVLEGYKVIKQIHINCRYLDAPYNISVDSTTRRMKANKVEVPPRYDDRNWCVIKKGFQDKKAYGATLVRKWEQYFSVINKLLKNHFFWEAQLSFGQDQPPAIYEFAFETSIWSRTILGKSLAAEFQKKHAAEIARWNALSPNGLTVAAPPVKDQKSDK